MREGLYRMSFATPTTTGLAVIVLRDGHILGGDPLLYYSGSYSVDGDTAEADIETERHARSTEGRSPFGFDHVHIHITATFSGDLGQFTGKTPQAPGVPLNGILKFLAG